MSQAQVYDNLKRDGPNVLTSQPKTPKLISFAENLFGGFGFLLLTGAILCFIAYAIHCFNNNGHLTDSLWLGIALIFVDILSACFSFYQVFKEEFILVVLVDYLIEWFYVKGREVQANNRVVSQDCASKRANCSRRCHSSS